MKPYYEDSAVTIFHGDCREVVRWIQNVDLVLTDPPYGIEGGAGKGRGKGNYTGAFTSADDTPEYVESVIIPVIQLCRGLAQAVIVTPGAKNLALYPAADSFGCFYQPSGVGVQRWGWVDSQPVLYYGVSPFQGRPGISSVFFPRCFIGRM